MEASRKRKFRRRLPYGEAPAEKLDTLESEQIKSFLHSQLSTRTSLQKELNRDIKFSNAVILKDSSIVSSGSKTLSEFQYINAAEKEADALRECHLSDVEITLKLRLERGELEEADLSTTDKARLEEIKRKLKEHKRLLQTPDRYSSTVFVNRREYDANAAAAVATVGDLECSSNYLVQRKVDKYPENDPVLATLREYESKQKCQTVQRNPTNVYEQSEEEFDESESDTDTGAFVGPVQLPVNERVTIIPEEEIYRNRFTLNQILEMKKFENYKAGEPNKILYIKNLESNVTTNDLGELFARFYKRDEAHVEYKLLQSGRMRGQAFVTFQDEKVATAALHLCNGYKLKGKPIIIQYGRSKDG